jgi:hypothetical protein
MTADEFLQYLARHDALRELEPTFTGLLLRTRLQAEAAQLATVTVIRTQPADDRLDPSELEAAG